MKRILVLIPVLMLLVGLISHAALADEPTGSVSGTVLLDGEPLAGVEVFLGVISSDGFDARVTCTDANGDFEFLGVPLDAELISASGPSWELNCDNAKFFDPYDSPSRPLMSQFYDHSNRPGDVVPFTSFSAPNNNVDYDIIRLPNDQPGINNFARQAMISCFDKGDTAKAHTFLARFLDAVDKHQAAGRIDAETVEKYRDYAGIVDWSWGVTCPTGS